MNASRVRALLLAPALGLLGFAAVDAAGRAQGVLTGMTASPALDAAVFALATAVSAQWHHRAWRRGGRAAAWGAALAHVATFPFLAGLLAGAADLTWLGGWGVPGLVRAALGATPANLLATFAVELPLVTLPLGALAVAGLAASARRGR